MFSMDMGAGEWSRMGRGVPMTSQAALHQRGLQRRTGTPECLWFSVSGDWATDTPARGTLPLTSKCLGQEASLDTTELTISFLDHLGPTPSSLARSSPTSPSLTPTHSCSGAGSSYSTFAPAFFSS